MGDDRLMNGPTLDFSDRPVGVVPRQFVPADALTEVPRMMRAGRLTDRARARSANASRPGDRRRNAGPEFPP